MPYKMPEDGKYSASDYYRAASRYKNKACNMTFDGAKKNLFDYSKFKEYKNADDFLEEYKNSGLVKSPDGKIDYIVKSTVSETLETVCRKCPHGTFDFRSDEPCEFEQDFSKAYEVCLALGTNVICERCGYAFDCSGQHDVKAPAIHDVRLNGRVSKLIVKRVHPVCPKCGRRVHAKPIEGIQAETGDKISIRLCKEITDLSTQTYGPAFMAQGYGLTRGTVQTRMKKVLERAREEKQAQKERNHRDESHSRADGESTLSYMCFPFEVGSKRYSLYCCHFGQDNQAEPDVYLCDVFEDESGVVEKWMSGDYSVRFDSSVPMTQRSLITYYHTGCMYPPNMHRLAYLTAMMIEAYTQYLFFFEDGGDKRAIEEAIDCCLIELQVPPCSVELLKAYVSDIIKITERDPVEGMHVGGDDYRERIHAAARELREYLDTVSPNVLESSETRKDENVEQFVREEMEAFVAELNKAMETVKGPKEIALWRLLYGNPAAIRVPRDMSAGQVPWPITEDGYYNVNYIRDEVPLRCLRYLLQRGLFDEKRGDPIPCAKTRCVKWDRTERDKVPCGRDWVECFGCK